MSYGHAGMLADGGTDPVAELDVATRRLGAWAELNPPLRGLHKDFQATLARFREMEIAAPLPPPVRRPRTAEEIAARMDEWRETWGGRLCARCGGRVLTGWVEPGSLVHVDREDWQDNPHDVVAAQGADHA